MFARLLVMPFNDFVSLRAAPRLECRAGTNVVGHDHEGVQDIVFEVGGIVLDGFDTMSATAGRRR